MADCSLALGSFDGLHKGHTSVLNAAKGARRMAVVFDIPPAMCMQGRRELLLPLDEKHSALKLFGFEIAVLDFMAVRDMNAASFFEYLFCEYSPSQICCGFNYRFGKNGEGDVALLATLCAQKNIELSVVPSVDEEGERVSSSRIRALIKNGSVDVANRLLGRSFSVSGTVSHGDERGRTLGFPTVNFPYPQDIVETRHGVYAAACTVDGKDFKAVTYIGHRPTYELKNTVCETNILDFSGDLYGRHLTVRLERFLREDKKFATKEELIKQIAEDISSAKK